MRVKAYDAITKQIIYRDMTAEEIAELEKMQSEAPAPEPTQEERIVELENVTDDIILLMAEIIGG